jgi:aminoglycoside phosphotransferase (APT) family kinase protein
MRVAEGASATAAAVSIGVSLGLAVENTVVLHDSNKLTLRLLPCDVVARVAPAAQQVAAFELELAQRLAVAGSPVAVPEPRVEPRVYERAGFVVTLWTHYEPLRAVPPVDYAHALARLHAGMRTVDLPTPHFTDRVENARQLVASRVRTPDLAEADRQLLDEALRRAGDECGGAAEQLLHGEPHPGNVIGARNGPVFVDLETCCRGPVEFDLAHAPDEIGDHYPGADQRLLRECRILVLAMITVWRWDRDDELPDGRRLGTEWLGQLRAALRP